MSTSLYPYAGHGHHTFAHKHADHPLRLQPPDLASAGPALPAMLLLFHPTPRLSMCMCVCVRMRKKCT